MKKLVLFYLLLSGFSTYSQELMKIGGRPPETYRAPVYITDESKGDIILQNVPTYHWSHGCSSTAAAMLVGYYDWNDYTGMYVGSSTIGLHCAPTNEHTWWDQDHCTISATAQTYDGLVNRGHVDDYYVDYLSTDPDPFITNNWAEHAWGFCVGDFMGTNQSYYSNVDGSTTFYNRNNNTKLFDYSACENLDPPRKDGCRGLRNFCEMMGYEVIQNYNQYIYGLGGIEEGFTFNDYKNEINNNRPVLIHIEGHTMLGYGYNNADNTIILHDTWDWSAHTMVWGDSYYNAPHLSVTVLELDISWYGVHDWVEIGSGPEILDLNDYYTYEATFYSYEGNSNPVNWNWKLKLLHDNGEYIVDEFSLNSTSMVNLFSDAMPSSLPNYSWIRNANGTISGKVIVNVLDNDGFHHLDEKIIEINYGPKNPFLMYAKYHNSNLFLSYYSPGTDEYIIYYDTDSGHPYSGNGAQQGSSPIEANNQTTFQINGLQECNQYYFSIKAENSSGISDYSNEETLSLVNPTNGLSVNYIFEDLNVYNDKIFNENYYFENNLIVESGVTLTINGSELYFSENSAIIIEQDGKLILDGATCTSECGNTWQGIQVWGNSEAHQSADANGDYQQGYLELINGATIENAIVAVELWNPGHWGTQGGMIYATDAIFRNNAKSIHALYYSNYAPNLPSIERDYNSNFKNCTFEITSNYIGDATFYKHIDLVSVRGIDFQGCDFSLNENAQNVSEWNNGIAAYGAKFSVTAFCDGQINPCPEEDYNKCTFTGFYSGIHALNQDEKIVTFHVNKAVFTNNTYGIFSRQVQNISVLFSEFSIGENKSSDKNSCSGAPGIGIYSELGTGFAFEENHFTKYSGAPDGNYLGISINTTEAADEIYKNYFDGLSFANYSEGYNWEGSNTWKGLAYYCNENTNNFADFYIGRLDDVGGIQGNQGDNTYVAGNTFSQTGADWHIYNDGNHWVVYSYNQNVNIENPDDDMLYHVIDQGYSIDNSCPSHYGLPIKRDNVILSPQEKTNTEQDYYSNFNSFNNVKTLYDNLTDGGDTEGEIIDIKMAQPSDMWDLRTQLLGNSPHLSLEVLKEVSDKTDVFTESVLFDILAANPDELKKDTLLSYLENKEQPLPEYMIDILRQVATGITYKTVLQQEMAKYTQKYSRAAHDMIRSNLNDTFVDYIELRNWLDNLGGISADRQIISTYIEEGNFTDAFTLANILPQLYKLEGIALIEHDYYLDMLALYQNLHQQNRNTHQLNNTEIADLEFIVDNSKGIAAAKAKNILEGAYGYHFYNCPNITGTDSYKSTALNMNAFADVYGINISVKPNPARDWAAFDYTLPESQSSAILTITDGSGKIIEELYLNGQQGQKLWDTRSIKSGVYVYTLKFSGIIKTGKIVVSK